MSITYAGPVELPPALPPPAAWVSSPQAASASRPTTVTLLSK
jgi:hypothetical protein